MSFIKDLFFPDPPEVTPIVVPGRSEEELELMTLQKQALEKSLAEPTEEEKLLAEKMKAYYETIISEGELSPEEEAAFNEEYGLQLEALKEEFGRETKKYGGEELAELVSRGMLESTVGEQKIASTQDRFAKILAGTQAEMLQSKETAKSNMEAAKMEMSTAGYSLAAGMSQSQMQTALQAAAGLQNYFLDEGAMKANAALTNALMNQAREKAIYGQRMQVWGGLANLGISMMKSGGAG